MSRALFFFAPALCAVLGACSLLTKVDDLSRDDGQPASDSGIDARDGSGGGGDAAGPRQLACTSDPCAVGSGVCCWDGGASASCASPACSSSAMTVPCVGGEDCESTSTVPTVCCADIASSSAILAVKCDALDVCQTANHNILCNLTTRTCPDGLTCTAFSGLPPSAGYCK